MGLPNKQCGPGCPVCAVAGVRVKRIQSGAHVRRLSNSPGFLSRGDFCHRIFLDKAKVISSPQFLIFFLGILGNLFNFFIVIKFTNIFCITDSIMLWTYLFKCYLMKRRDVKTINFSMILIKSFFFRFWTV